MLGGLKEETKIYKPNNRRKRPRRASVLRMSLIALGVAIVVVAGLLVGRVYTFLGGLQPERKPTSVVERAPTENMNILVMGVDSGVNGAAGGAPGTGATRSGQAGREGFASAVGRSVPQRNDVLFLVSVDTEVNEVSVISIPRDSRVAIPGRAGYEKIAHAHVWGGPDLVVKTVTQLLDVPIHHYIKVDFAGFKAIVDQLGGVEIDVKQRMYYVDPYQNLKIDLYPGRQVLDGEKALQFVRFRQYPQGDIARIEAEHQFLQAVADKLFQMRTIWKAPALAETLSKYVETDMSPTEILGLAKTVAGFKTSKLKMVTLPGRDATITEGNLSLSYWVIDRHEARKIVDRYVFGIDPDRNAQISIEVLNGAGIPRLAGDLSKVLAEMGFRIARVDNASSTGLSVTEVYIAPDVPDRGAVERSVLRALNRVGIKPKVMRSPGHVAGASGPGSGAGVTIVAGYDFAVKRPSTP